MHRPKLILAFLLHVALFFGIPREGAAQVRIVQPTTGATLSAGQVVSVEWENQPANATTVLEQFVFNEWTTIATGVASPFLWTVPQTTQSVSLRLHIEVADPPTLIEEYPNPDIQTFHTAFETPDEQYVVAYGFLVTGPQKEHVVRVWERGNPAVIVNEFRETFGDPSYNDLELYPHGGSDSLLFTIGSALRIIPVASNIGNTIVFPDMEEIYAVAVHPTLPIIAVCDRDNGDGVRVFDMNSRTVLARFQSGEQTPIYSVEFSSDGNYVLYGSGNSLIVRDWRNEVDGSIPFGTVLGLTGFVKSVAWTDQPAIVRVSTFGGRLYQVNLQSQTATQIGMPLQGQAWQIDTRDDGDRTLVSDLLTSASPRTGSFFQFVGGNTTPLSETQHGGDLFYVGYSEDGERIVSAGTRDQARASEPSVVRVWTAGEWFEENTTATFDVQVQAQIVLPVTTANAGDESTLFVVIEGAQDILQEDLDLQFQASFTYPSQLWFPLSEYVVQHDVFSLGRNLVTVAFTPQDLQQDSILAIKGVALLGRPIRDALLWSDVQVVPQLLELGLVNGDYGIYESCFTNSGPYPKTTIKVDPPTQGSWLNVTVEHAPNSATLAVCDINGKRLYESQSLPTSLAHVVIEVDLTTTRTCIVYIADAQGNVVARQLVHLD